MLLPRSAASRKVGDSEACPGQSVNPVSQLASRWTAVLWAHVELTQLGHDDGCELRRLHVVQWRRPVVGIDPCDRRVVETADEHSPIEILGCLALYPAPPTLLVVRGEEKDAEQRALSL